MDKRKERPAVREPVRGPGPANIAKETDYPHTILPQTVPPERTTDIPHYGCSLPQRAAVRTVADDRPDSRRSQFLKLNVIFA